MLTRTQLAHTLRQFITNTSQVNRIEKALVGEDLQSGLVAKVHQLEVTQKILIALGSTSLVGLVSLAIILIEEVCGEVMSIIIPAC